MGMLARVRNAVTRRGDAQQIAQAEDRQQGKETTRKLRVGFIFETERTTKRTTRRKRRKATRRKPAA